MRNEVSDAEREEVRAQLGAEWTRLEAGWNEGDKSSVAPWVPGFPARMPLSGLGGGRLLVLAPEPVLWPTWQIVVDNHRNVRGLLFEHVDIHGKPVDRLGQHAKRASPLGNMHVYSSSSGKRLALPLSMSASQADEKFGSVGPAEENSEAERTPR